jgi:hypothetical protein
MWIGLKSPQILRIWAPFHCRWARAGFPWQPPCSTLADATFTRRVGWPRANILSTMRSPVLERLLRLDAEDQSHPWLERLDGTTQTSHWIESLQRRHPSQGRPGNRAPRLSQMHFWKTAVDEERHDLSATVRIAFDLDNLASIRTIDDGRNAPFHFADIANLKRSFDRLGPI